MHVRAQAKDGRAPKRGRLARWLTPAVALACAASITGHALAQPTEVERRARASQWRSGGGIPWGANEGDNGSLVWTEGSGIIDEDLVKTARETASHSTGTPEWTNPRGFEKDVFTFARVVFKSGIGTGNGIARGWRLGWWVDYPDADLNFSYRLQQLTTIRSDPDGRVLKFTDPALHDYPLLYIEHAGYMRLRDPEIEALRKYFQSGGAMLVNDFWSQAEWNGFAAQMKRVLPEKDWIDLPLDHPVFHCVFNLNGPMHKLQVPTIQFWNPDHNPDDPSSPPLQRVFRGDGSEEMHVRAMLDDHQRIMIIVIHNSDISDGWEREGENTDYFHTFSEKVAYPLGINMIFYLMTH